MANGLVNLYKPALTKSKGQLKELTDKQQLIIEQLHSQNLSLSRTQHSIELQEMFNVIKIQIIKLQNIKRDMKSLHEKSIKLKVL